MNIPKTIELYTENGQVDWHVNHISVKLLPTLPPPPKKSDQEVRQWTPPLGRCLTTGTERDGTSAPGGEGAGRVRHHAAWGTWADATSSNAASASRRSAVFRDLYDRTSAHAQGALYAWMAARLRTPCNATGEPGLRGGVAF